MASWRDDVSIQTQDDLDGLLDAAMRFAQQMLDKRGGFLPYGMALSSEGQQRLLGADPGLGEHPSSEAVLDVLYAGVKHDQAVLRCYAVVAPFVLLDEGDAIRVELEHQDGVALTVAMPYAINGRFTKNVEYGQLRAGPGEHRVWPKKS